MPKIVLLLAFIPLFAAAQTACPVGVAPGSPQCGPDSGTSRADSAPSRPTGEWIKTWGAIAGSAQGDQGWSSNGKYSENEASQDVLKKCTSSGATDCTVDLTYFNQCVAIAVPAQGGGKGSMFTGKDEQVASARALDQCKVGYGVTCSISFTDCTKPIFKKY
ncbi:DUF4189 domain-containing protein [Pseudomonas viridiflava]